MACSDTEHTLVRSLWAHTCKHTTLEVTEPWPTTQCSHLFAIHYCVSHSPDALTLMRQWHTVQLKLLLFITLNKYKTCLTLKIQAVCLCLVQLFDLLSRSGEASQSCSVFLGLCSQPICTYLTRSRIKCARLQLQNMQHALWLACTHRHTSRTLTLTSTFFIIILGLIGSNYLPCF